MTATTTIVLYNEDYKEVISEVYAGQKYYIPETTSVFKGTLIEFLALNPDYTTI